MKDRAGSCGQAGVLARAGPRATVKAGETSLACGRNAARDRLSRYGEEETGPRATVKDGGGNLK